LKAGAVQAVLQATLHKYALIVVNAEVRSSDLFESLEPARIPQSSDRVYKPEENQRLFIDVANYLSFVGGVVIKRQLWLEREKGQYIGTGFIHIGVLFQRPISERALVIAEPLISIRYGDALYMRSSRYFEIWMFIWPDLIWSFTHLCEKARRAVCQKEPWRRKRTLLLQRAKGAYSKSEYHNWLVKRSTSRWDRLNARLVASVPGPIANLIAVIYYYVSGRLSRQQLVDLTKSPFYFGGVFEVHAPVPKAGQLSKTTPVSQKTS
jgi:abequosyltransferase